MSMEKIENMNARRFEKIGYSASAGRLSPLETFQRTLDLVNAIQEGYMDRLAAFNQSYLESASQLKDVSQLMADLANELHNKNADIEDLHRFLENIGMKKEYDRRKYKRQMNAIYRRAQKGECGK